MSTTTYTLVQVSPELTVDGTPGGLEIDGLFTGMTDLVIAREDLRHSVKHWPDREFRLLKTVIYPDGTVATGWIE
jgi:hypothetical protein